MNKPRLDRTTVKNRRCEIRLTNDERDKFIALAKKLDMNFSNLFRKGMEALEEKEND